jgi:4-alpha-glucanotransferase
MPTAASHLPRSSGILLHPTSLPGPYGIGDLGPAAFAWIDSLARARQTWWQVLPLGPTGYGDSPYQCFSAFAGNVFLISPDLLLQDGLLNRADIPSGDFQTDHVEFEQVLPFKLQVTARAWNNFRRSDSPLRAAFTQFCLQEAAWLDDFALFLAIKATQGERSWQEWPRELRRREPAALEPLRRELADPIGLHQFRQFLFARQWQAVKEYAHRNDIRLIGDVPIFVALDSADVWRHPELFMLDEHRQPTAVAGVPPDYFAVTGQLWGNPLYHWPAHRESGYAWWIARLRATLSQVDLVRLDHFRGFEAYWEIPAGSPTAENGRWVKGPGNDFIAAVKPALGGLPLIAEDLGVITPEVEALRTHWHLPGMRILQFAFGGAREARFLPHRYDRNTIVYTGTHDNDTTVGWFDKLTTEEHQYFRRYAPKLDGNVAWRLIRMAWASVANVAIAPLQDVLSLPGSSRMNLPGTPNGNWRWRFAADAVTPDHIDRLAEFTETYERMSKRNPPGG